MKIICIDNFDSESVSDTLIASDLTEKEAIAKAAELNKKYGGDYSPLYYKAVLDDYKLYTFEP